MSASSSRTSIKLLLLPLFLLALSCGRRGGSGSSDSVPAADSGTVQSTEIQTPDSLEAGREALLRAYPDFIKEIADNRVIMADSTFITYDDDRKKDFPELLDDTDVQDMFYRPYRVPDKEPDYLEDVGRMRSEALFKKMYGASSQEVNRNLVNVTWFGQTVRFNRRNGAADSLKAVAAELKEYPELRKYLKSSGTFNWRPVRGAKRMSAHSYGIAFDIGVEHSDYWQWKSGNNNELARIRYSNRIPRKIVEIFERHGFIWGGSWYHFDTMHFEFRPEILWHARLLK